MALAYEKMAHNGTTLRHLRRGDRIQFDRGAYSHWGIYLGCEEVIHLTGTEEGGIRENINSQHSLSISGMGFDKAKVCIENFWDIVGKNVAFKNNDKDRKWGALDPENIVARAMSQLGNVQYNLFNFNCEHFVNWSRYDVIESDQADILLGGLRVAGIIGGAAALAFLAYNQLNKRKQKRNRKSY